ncbi:hypothetical protein F5887DRAFT_125690 [Amanita rubescens]|nr:hypothetical protein F5887DRAFT_125690 [Amanita rubescens]
MLFSYALLFFLFTTFVAAAPTTMLQKRSDYDITTNKDFLVANDAVWTRDKSESKQHSSVDKIKWLIKEEKSMYGALRYLYVKVGPEGTEHKIDNTVTADKKPGSDLIGTWERTGTVSLSRLERIDVIYTVDLVKGSKIKMSKVARHGYDEIDFKVLVEGEWERGKVKGLSAGWEVFEEHMPFLTAAGGVWDGAGGEKIIFSETLDPYNLKKLTSEYITKSEPSTPFVRWHDAEGRGPPETVKSGTQWERKKNG